MLKETLSKIFKVDSLIENLTGFVETRVELLKIEVKEEVAKGLAKSTAWLLIAFILMIFVIFISISLALLIGERLGAVAGFMIISGVYFVTGLILLLSRRKVILKLEETFMNMFRKKS